MTVEHARKLSELYGALAEGKEIQMKMGDEKNNWEAFDDYDSLPIYNHKLLRVKPEPKYRPYTTEEILNYIDYCKKEFKDYPIFINVSEDKEYRLIGVNNEHIIATEDGFELRVIELSAFLTSWYIWKDRLPCGVEIVE